MAEALISIISPIYKAESLVDRLVESIVAEAIKITSDYEIILVEDGSPDNSWLKISENCSRNKKIKGIKLSRNFGQHFAITAGIELATGAYIIVMDCDLQDDPKYIAELYNSALKGYDIVYTEKEQRKHSKWKNITAGLFNRLFNYLVDNKSWKASSNIGSYSLITRKVADSFKLYNDYQRHYLMVLRWLGYTNTSIIVEHKERYEGKSSYNISKLLLHAINGITSQSDKLLRINVAIGLLLSALSFLGILIIIVLYFMHGFLYGWTSTAVLILFSTGMILTSIGITGLYVGKTFEQTKNRPKYIIDKFLNS
jgi:glycosyltransferase involved in cell wall biosynthesis